MRVFNLANNATGSEDLKAIANYFDNIAVFAEQAVVGLLTQTKTLISKYSRCKHWHDCA